MELRKAGRVVVTMKAFTQYWSGMPRRSCGRNTSGFSRLAIVASLLGALWANGAAAQSALPAHPEQRLTDEEALALGWNRKRLAAAREYTADLNTEAVVILAGGKLLDEWGAVDQKFNVHSIRKSFLSALVGIRVAQGKIRLGAILEELGLDDNAPSLSPEEKRATVGDLLKARSGVYHAALYETPRMRALRPQRYSHQPGSFWYYNNWDFNALGTLYERAADSSIYADIESFIAQPIGMQDFVASDGSYVTGEDSIHRAYPFRMTARDLARFGLLFVRNGNWHGKQIVPADWVRDSVRAYSEAGESGGYGYLWWVERSGMHLPGVTLPPGSFSARGFRGHYVLCVPALDLVLVHRVNTDIDERRVEASEFGELVRQVLNAWEPPAELPLATRLALLMSRHRVPGVAVVQIEQRRVAGECYLGAQEAGKPAAVTADTLFEAASMTKPLAAFAALKLVEQGKLDLDRPLVEYLGGPYIKGESLHEKITARMVLTHTSGLPNWRPKGGPLEVMHEPGSAFRYSGEGFQFLQRVIEKIVNSDLEDYLRRILLVPLAMNHSSLVWRPELAAHAAEGHDAKGRVKKGRRLYMQPQAAYSLYCSALDYASFVLELMNPDSGAPHSLKAETVKQMFTPVSPPAGLSGLSRRGHPVAEDTRYGLGWVVEPAPSGPRIRHSGSNGTGFRSHVEFDPVAGHGIIIMTNGDNGDALWRDLVEAVGVP